MLCAGSYARCDVIQLEDIGYGIKKLRIMVQVVDDDVSVDDDLVEVICGFEDHVQSCDIFAFNKV